jgi:hypothetical protein
LFRGFASIDKAARDLVSERAELIDLSVYVALDQLGRELWKLREVRVFRIEPDCEDGFLACHASIPGGVRGLGKIGSNRRDIRERAPHIASLMRATSLEVVVQPG